MGSHLWISQAELSIKRVLVDALPLIEENKPGQCKPIYISLNILYVIDIIISFQERRKLRLTEAKYLVQEPTASKCYGWASDFRPTAGSLCPNWPYTSPQHLVGVYQTWPLGDKKGFDFHRNIFLERTLPFQGQRLDDPIDLPGPKLAERKPIPEDVWKESSWNRDKYPNLDRIAIVNY